MLQFLLARCGAPGSATLAHAGAVDWPALQRALRAAHADREPVCVLGTAFGWIQVLDAAARDGFAIELPERSRGFETGGYKGRSRTLSRPALHAALAARFGVPANYIVSEYGMTEMGSQLYTLGLRRALTGEPGADDAWSYPAWLRPRLVDPDRGMGVDLDAVAGVDFGLVMHHDLANLTSVAHLLTGDLGRRDGVSFELAGRRSNAPMRGCGLVDEPALGA
jgi:hypothetical protein